MVADGLLTRQRYREVPPRVDYELTESARDLLPVVGAVARWGWRWAWGAPSDGEAVDIGAVLRTLPGLSVDRDAEGTIAVIVERPEGARHHALHLEGGAVTIAERDADDADAVIRGDEAAFVAALSPDEDRSGLDVSGDAALAALVLDALTPHSARDATVA